MIAPPQSHAWLDKSITGTDSRISTASVEALTGAGLKREKRTELVAAVDGVGISIYSTQSWKLVASYPVPPQCIFSGPPCSVLLRPGDKTRTRLTYGSIRGPQHEEIKCFTETLSKSGLSTGIDQAARPLEERENPVVLLTAAPLADGSDIVLLVTHQDGRIRCLSRDLQTEHWLAPSLTEGAKLEHTVFLSIEKARSGFLKDYEDLVLDTSPESTLLALVSRRVGDDAPGKHAGSFSLLSFQRAAQEPTTSSCPFGRPEVIRSLRLEPGASESTTEHSYHFHDSRGQLARKSSNSIEVYELCGLAPRLRSRVECQDDVVSLVWISSTSLAFTTKSSIQLLNIDYSTVFDLGSLQDGSSSKSKREMSPSSELEAVTLLPCPGNRGTVIGLRGRELVSFTLPRSAAGAKSTYKMAQGMSLADLVGKGTAQSASTAPSHAEDAVPDDLGDVGVFDDSAQSKALKRRLRTAAKNADDNGIDEAVEQFFSRFSASSELIDRNKPDRQQIWQSMQMTHHQRQKIAEPLSYILSKIFKHKEMKSKEDQLGGVLTIRALPPRTFQLLVANGLFDQDQLEKALKRTEHLPNNQTLPPCAMIQALTTWDPSLHSLMCLLASPALLTVHETMHALRSGLDLFQASQSTPPDTKLLTNGSPPASPHLTNGHATSPSPSPSPAPLSDTLHDACALIQLCLARLPDASDAAVTRALRHDLGPAHIPRLLDHLRAALAGAGWFTRYTDPSPRASPDPTSSTDAPPPTDHHLAHAARVIGCALDALGPAAWLAAPDAASTDEGGFGDAVDDRRQRVAHLRAEISAALEAVEEAAYLDGLLRSVLLFARRAAPERGHGDAEDEVAGEQARGMTVSGRGRARPVRMDMGEGEKALMPLGLRPVGTVEGEKKGGDGRPVKRSKREVGHLKSRKVGAYSFERIVI